MLKYLPEPVENFPSLVHYSMSGGFKYFESKQATIDSFPIKPEGLWVTVENCDYPNTWLDFCVSEDFNLHKLKNKFRVTLKPKSKILWLKTCEDIDHFTSQYKMTVAISPRHLIDWVKVAKDYQGIFIVPYQYERRLTSHTFWYYGWDCASGCLWGDVVESIKKLPHMLTFKNETVIE